jgi:SpoIID/LytB domain protein
MTSISDYKFEHDGYNTDFRNERNAQKWIKGNPPAFCNTTDKRVLLQVLLEYDQKTADYYRWKVEYTQSEIAGLINTKLGMDFGDITDLIPVERGPSSRMIKLKIVGSKKTLTIGKELEIRRALSKSHLYSSAFVIEKSDIKNDVPGKFTLYGAGWGHGVGLCQIGAAVMSEMGYSFDEILLHYFKGAKIKKLYD